MLGGLATGTGSDCIAIAAPPGQAAFAGLHTEIGEALGRVVYDAVAAGATDGSDRQVPPCAASG